MDEDVATEAYAKNDEIEQKTEIQYDKYCDFFIIAAILLVIGAAAKVALVYFLWKTKQELKELKRKNHTALDNNALLNGEERGGSSYNEELVDLG